MGKRILIIKQLWNPEPTAKSLDFAQALVQEGFEVEVLTGFPNYPIGRIYEGYRQNIWTVEYLGGIRTVRVPIYPQHSSKAFIRMLGYLSFGISSSLLGPFLCKKPDLIFAYQGSITIGMPALTFKFFRKVPFVYDINDLWPETVAASGMLNNSYILKFIKAWSRINLSNASLVTVATKGFKDSLIYDGFNSDKIKVISNWSRDEFMQDKLPENTRNEFFKKDCFNILYAGNLGIVQSLYSILDAMKYFQDNSSNINLILLGDGAEKEGLINYVEKENLANVRFLPRVTSTEVSKFLNSADALLVHLKKTPLFEITIPSKILSYLRTSKPILCGLSGNAAELVLEANAGECFEPENPLRFCEAVYLMLSKLEEGRGSSYSGGLEYYNRNLGIETATATFAEIFDKIIDE